MRASTRPRLEGVWARVPLVALCDVCRVVCGLLVYADKATPYLEGVCADGGRRHLPREAHLIHSNTQQQRETARCRSDGVAELTVEHH